MPWNRFARWGCAFVLSLIGAATLIAQAPQAQPGSPLVALRMIVVATPEEAAQVLARLQQGADFAALARTLSIDPSARDGGWLGRLDPAVLRAEVRAALNDLQPKNVTRPVTVATGVAVLQVAADAGGTVPSAINPASLAAISAVGSVKFVPDIGGLPEAEALLRDFPKAGDWNRHPQSICQARQDSIVAGQQLFEDFFGPAGAAMRRAASPFQVMQAHLGLAQLLSYQGLMARAVEHYAEAYRLALASVPGAVPQVEEMLGVAHFHKAGMDSNIFRQPSEVCLIPAQPGHAYARTDDLTKAVELFRKYLERRPDDLEVRWLLNAAHMALGNWPEAVPQALRIAENHFSSSASVGRFRDAAPAMGLNVFASAGGVIVDDLMNAGRLDVMTSNFYSCGPLHFFASNGDGTYSSRAPASGLREQVGGLNIVQADYNNDRCTDVLVQRGGWEVAQRSSLLRNNCDGTFTDVTVEAGLDTPTSTQAAAWADIDNDGWLDLFVGNEDRPAQLFLNDGKGHFTDIARAAGVNRQTFAKGVAAGDFDNDGFVDFYVSNYDGVNLLYRNNRDRTFSERAGAAGVPGPGRGFATWFFDYDNDGWLDIYVTSYFMSVDDTARTYLSLPHNAPTMKLYRNTGKGSFEDVTVKVGLDKVFMPMGANFGDIDNDGFLDMYLGMGTPSYASIAPHVLLHNREGRQFEDVTAVTGTGEIHKGHGIAFADLDNDGDEEIVAEIGGATPGDSHAMRVFENPGNGNDWISLKLTGSKSNRSAMGARISVTVENGGVRRVVHRQVSSGGSFGASPLEQHIGLGPDARLVSVDIWWPVSNTRQHFTDLVKNAAYAVAEDGASATRIARQRIQLGGVRSAER